MLKDPLAPWSRNRESLLTFFSHKEVEKLECARKNIDLTGGLFVYCVYENPFAKSGGIFTVAENYCATLRKKGIDLIVLTPYHEKLKTAPPLFGLHQIRKKKRLSPLCRVPFNNKKVPIKLFEYTHRNVRWVFLRAHGFFTARGGESGTDPYIHKDSSRLIINSLFMSAAIPYALSALGYKKDLLIHLNDWELAPAALTVKEAVVNDVLESAAVVLTSHNPYDHALSTEALGSISQRPYRGALPTHTIYQYMIPLTDAPLCTVSKNFAEELLSDPLQTEYFCNHLQEVFKHHGLIGIDNGLFGEPKQAYSPSSLEQVGQGKPGAVLDEKLCKRKVMLNTLARYKDSRILGSLDGEENRPLDTLPDNIPVFVMFGRLDPGQKGFDLLAQAIRVLPPKKARFILTPIIAAAPGAYREDLKTLVERRPGEVMIYPFRLEHGYPETMAGATYAIMPSFYEPFGGATEAVAVPSLLVLSLPGCSTLLSSTFTRTVCSPAKSGIQRSLTTVSKPLRTSRYGLTGRPLPTLQHR